MRFLRFTDVSLVRSTNGSKTGISVIITQKNSRNGWFRSGCEIPELPCHAGTKFSRKRISERVLCLHKNARRKSKRNSQMNTKRHAFTEEKRHFSRFRGNVLSRGARDRNIALTGLGGFVSRVVGFRLASPYADRLCPVEAWFARRRISLFSREDIAREREFSGARNIGTEWAYFCPEGAKLVSIGQAQRSPMDSGKKVGTLKECDSREDI